MEYNWISWNIMEYIEIWLNRITETRPNATQMRMNNIQTISGNVVELFVCETHLKSLTKIIIDFWLYIDKNTWHMLDLLNVWNYCNTTKIIDGDVNMK